MQSGVRASAIPSERQLGRRDIRSYRGGEWVKMLNHRGELVAELNVMVTPNGTITVNTMYDTWTGRVVAQTVSETDHRRGSVQTKTVLGGKVLP